MDHAFYAEWSSSDQEWVGKCPDYPSLSWLNKSPAIALEGIKLVVQECDDDLTAEMITKKG